MKVEIWSDVTCVHCYMAKRKFEQALSQFSHADNIKLVWKSFELAPGLSVAAGKSMYEFLADYNRASLDQVKAICNQITKSAREVGLIYNFDIAKPANSFRSHRLLHLAKQYDLQSSVKEALFKAHFTEGKNIDDLTTLTKLGVEAGLNPATITSVLESEQYTDEVRQDIQQARMGGIKGVPFYRFNGQVEVTGVQDTELYLKVLTEAYAESQMGANKSAQVCKTGEGCL